MPVCKLPSGPTIGYDETGSGPPLLLIHAFPLDRRMWAPQIPAFAEVARVITLDLPGFGESSPADPFTIEGAADTVAEFLSAQGITKATVCGLSMGGYIALTLARQHAGVLSALILADTRAGIDDSNTKASRDRAIVLVNEKGSAALFEGMLPKVLSDAARGDAALVSRLKEIAAQQPAANVAAALAALRERPDANAGLKTITVPTLVLVGEFDGVTPPLSAANLSGQIRASKLVHIPGAGHLSNVEKPDAFNAAVRDFLAAR